MEDLISITETLSFSGQDKYGGQVSAVANNPSVVGWAVSSYTYRPMQQYCPAIIFRPLAVALFAFLQMLL